LERSAVATVTPPPGSESAQSGRFHEAQAAFLSGQHAVTSLTSMHYEDDGVLRAHSSAPGPRVPEMDNRYLRVILLSDGETVHNAFFDRRFAS
jgi:hypothetical protein